MLTGTLLSFASRPDKGEADHRKAEYIFLEAANAVTEERYDDYYMLLRRAAALDSADPFIAGALAEIRIADSNSDSTVLAKAYNDLKRRWEANPSDDNNTNVFATVARKAGRIDDVIGIWETVDSLRPDRTDPAMNLATALVVRGTQKKDTADINRAIGIYRRIGKGLQGNVQLSSRLIGAYASKGDTSAIIDEMQRLNRNAPADIEAALYIGSVYNSLEQPDSALRFFDRACEIDSTNGLVYLARAAFFQSRGDSAAYDREVFRALESPELDFAPKFELLSDYVIKLYNDSALQPRIDHMFEVLQEVNPGEGVLHAFYGDYKSTIGDPAGAAEQYSYSIDLDPENQNVWQNLISTYGQLQETEKMAVMSQKATRRFPDSPYFPLNAAAALSQLKRYGEAIETLDSLDMSRLDPHIQSLVFGTKGDVFYASGQPDSAFVNYHSAIELDPKNYMAMNNAAYYMSQTGTDLPTAALYASMATTSDPMNVTYIDTQAWVYFKSKDYQKSRETMDKALKLCGIIENNDIVVPEEEREENKPSSEIYDHAGDIYYMTGEPVKAVEFWEQALQLDPDNEAIKKKVTHKAYFFE